MYQVKEKDWKQFRKMLPEWQEAYMERLTKEYIELLSSDMQASDKFWALDKRIKDDSLTKEEFAWYEERKSNRGLIRETLGLTPYNDILKNIFMREFADIHNYYTCLKKLRKYFKFI